MLKFGPQLVMIPRESGRVDRITGGDHAAQDLADNCCEVAMANVPLEASQRARSCKRSAR